MAPTAKYAPLHRSSPDSDTQNGPWLKRGLRQVSKSPVTRTRSEIAAIIAGLLLVLSATANILLGIQLAKTTTQCTLGPSPNIAKLSWDVPNLADVSQLSLEDEEWDAPRFDSMIGHVALDHSFAKRHGLRHAQNWPWDQSKGIYILQGFHALHCVQMLRDYLRRNESDGQTWGPGHVTHCLNVLRDDIICRADDFAHYTGGVERLEGGEKKLLPPGTGQIRMCRSWDKLYQFAVTNSACFNRPKDRYVPVLDRYKHCPDGSTPWEDTKNR